MEDVGEVVGFPKLMEGFGLADVASALTTPAVDRMPGFPSGAPDTFLEVASRRGCRTTYAWGVAHLFGDSINPLTTCAT